MYTIVKSIKQQVLAEGLSVCRDQRRLALDPALDEP